MQFEFDPRYAKISATMVKEAAEARNFTLVSHTCSTLAGGKSVVLYFASRGEAERAEKELPKVLRQREQKDASYSIKTTVLKYNDAQNIIKAAKEQREQQTGFSAASGTGGGAGAAAPQPQVVFLQAPTAYPAQGYVQNPGMVPVVASPAVDGTQASMYSQTTAYPLHPGPTYTIGPNYSAADAAAAGMMPMTGSLAQGGGVDHIEGIDLEGILNAAEVGAGPEAAGARVVGGLGGPAGGAAGEKEDEFLSLLDTLRSGVPNM